MLSLFPTLSRHAAWADRLLLDALHAAPVVPADARRELAHVLGTSETWLARIEHRSSRVPIWPDRSLDDLRDLAATIHAAYDRFVNALTDASVAGSVSYVNSQGLSFENTVHDILMHNFLHGQYHRGKVNLLLRRAGLSPAPTDYIAFVRGTPAARTP